MTQAKKNTAVAVSQKTVCQLSGIEKKFEGDSLALRKSGSVAPAKKLEAMNSIKNPLGVFWLANSVIATIKKAAPATDKPIFILFFFIIVWFSLCVAI